VPLGVIQKDFCDKSWLSLAYQTYKPVLEDDWEDLLEVLAEGIFSPEMWTSWYVLFSASS
jgi:hypothetical protein